MIEERKMKKNKQYLYPEISSREGKGGSCIHGMNVNIL